MENIVKIVFMGFSDHILNNRQAFNWFNIG